MTPSTLPSDLRGAAGHHAPLPTSGRALNGVAISATLHCLTGCAIGEVVGMLIGTAAGFSNLGTIVISVALAFVFGYSLTSLPLLRAGMALAAAIPIALATDTFSIATMEVIDNAIMVVVPGAMDAGLGDILFWGSLSFALVVAGVGAFPVNRWLITRGKGHAVLHETGIHGGPNLRVVAAVAVGAAVFGTVVLANQALSSDGEGHSSGHGGMSGMSDSGVHAGASGRQDGVRGLAVAEHGMKLELARSELPRARRSPVRFRILDSRGDAIRDFEIEHTKRITSSWLAATSAGVFADFKRNGRNETLASDAARAGDAAPRLRRRDEQRGRRSRRGAGGRVTQWHPEERALHRGGVRSRLSGR